MINMAAIVVKLKVEHKAQIMEFIRTQMMNTDNGEEVQEFLTELFIRIRDLR